jgi:3-oxoacyl-[acyl-carrier protein] reductase
MELQRHPRLSGLVAIVTGGSRGIGERIAFELAQNGAKVTITYTSPGSETRLSTLIDRINALNNGASAITVKADLRDPASPSQIVAETIRHFGDNIDILVNNAGVELVKPIPDISVADFSFVYDLNVRAPMLMLQAVLPYLRAPGRIINIGSVVGRHGFKQLSTYCSSKAALEGLTRCWAAELGSSGHTVNSVNPGPVQTEMLENIPKEAIEMQKSQTPIQNRVGTVEDIAPVVVWLASEESRWITGQVISASGGWAMY